MLKDTFREWSDDNASSLGAALSYYTILSIGPVLMLVITIVSYMLGTNDAGRHIEMQMQQVIGKESAHMIAAIAEHSQRNYDGFWAAAIGIATLLFTSTITFGQLQDALNHIWKVKASQRGILVSIRRRFLSFVMIAAIGIILFFSVLLSALTVIFADYTGDMLPEWVLHGINFMVSLGVLTVLFAMIYKILPDVHLRWRHVWMGAGITAFLFTIGKLAIALYLSHSNVVSAYGAAGSLILILLWVYYSAQIIFLGAEFTQVYVRYAGARVKPTKEAHDEGLSEKLAQ